MQQSKEFILSKDIVTETVGQGVTRQILGYNNKLMLVKVMFETGSVGDIHSHPHTQSSYIASGKFEVNISGKKQILSTGEAFFIPSGKPHGVTCLEEGVIIDTFNPTRTDFLIS